MRPFKILVPALAIALAGCIGGNDGPTLYKVTGTLTKGGKPLPNVTVTFSPIDGGPSSGGMTNDEGKFTLVAQNGKTGAVVGKHKVVLTSTGSGTGGAGPEYGTPEYYEKLTKEHNQQAAAARGDAAAQEAEEGQKSFPEEYGSPSTTPVEREVKAETNDFDIPIP